MLPYYLKTKLIAIGINSLDKLVKYDYFKVFQWLKYKFPSLGYQALYDLCAINNSLPIGSLSEEQQADIVKTYKQSLPSYPPLPNTTIINFLYQAQELAAIAHTNNEIPIGAVIVTNKGNSNNNGADENFVVIGKGYNSTLKQNSILCHAEIIAIIEAQKHLNNHRLDNCDLYVTIEPCLMCMGAIMHSRIRRVIFGAIEPKTGAIISQYNVLQNKSVNHQTEALGPIDNEFYSQQLKLFMQQKR